MSRVLVAVDGSDSAAQAAVKATQLLGRDHDYYVVEAVQISVPVGSVPMAVGPGYGLGPSPAMLQASLEAAMVEGYDDVAMAIRRMRVAANPLVVMGSPAEVISEAVSIYHVDLLVMGSHGKGLAERVLAGSVSHQILKDPPCPVLVVPV